jgi:hypothetical protein
MSKTPTIRTITDNAFFERKSPRKVERAIFDGNVRHQHAPFYEVLSKGTMVEYTDRRDEAHAAYSVAGLPKEIVKVTVVAGRGFRQVIERISDIQHRKVA